MKLGDFDLFGDGRRREEIHGGSSKHGFARAGRTREKNVVVSGNGDREGAFGEFLTLDIVKNWTFRRSDFCIIIFYNRRFYRYENRLSTRIISTTMGFDEFNLTKVEI